MPKICGNSLDYLRKRAIERHSLRHELFAYSRLVRTNHDKHHHIHSVDQNGSSRLRAITNAQSEGALVKSKASNLSKKRKLILPGEKVEDHEVINKLNETSQGGKSDEKHGYKWNEIDELFAGKSKKKKENSAIVVVKEEKITATKRPKPNQRRYTEEGFPIYTYEELKMDQPKGLNGPCPWDCNCCF